MQLLDYKTTKDLLEKYSIPTPETYNLESRKDIENLEKDFFPVVVKAFSPEILHRSGKGLIFKDIKNKKELQEKFKKIKENAPKESIFLVQNQVEGVELACGMKRDSTFGPAILFGLGGIFIEILEDIKWEIAPVNLEKAKEMINSIKAKKLLTSYRGKDEVNIKKVAEIIVKVSKLSMQESLGIKEIDFNPIIANKSKALVTDFKFLV